MDNRHREFYEGCIQRTNSVDDPYRKALFYTLGLTDETRRNINHLYDFEERGIDFTGLFEPWQTGTSNYAHHIKMLIIFINHDNHRTFIV
jgi:hypothetical protein